VNKLLIGIALALAVGIAERAVWRMQMNVIGFGGDAKQYYSVAQSLSSKRTLSFDGVTPEWTRLPGYPVMLWALQIPPEGDRAAGRRWLQRAQWLNLLLDVALAGLVVLLGRALGAGRWAWAGGAAWLLQPWATLTATIPLSDLAGSFLDVACLVAALWAMNGRARRFLLPGALAAAAQYVRGDAVLLVPMIALAALLGRDGRRNWRGAALGVCAYLVLFSAWPLRNLAVFGTPHWLGGGTNIDAHGGYFDRSAVMAWMRTWAASEQATVGVGWRFPFRPVTIAELPPDAVDAEELPELHDILARYDAAGARLDDTLRGRLSQLAAARAWRHPLRTFVWLPLRRMALMLFPPRDGFGLGPLPALANWRPLYISGDALVTVAALVALFYTRRRAATQLCAAYLGLRLLLMGWMPTSEPRYFLPALPVVYALAATLPAQRKTA
jgi:hypothetical protein